MLTGMKQSSLDLNLSTRKTRKQDLLAQMDRVVPWAALVELIAPYYPEGKNGRPPFALEAMLRVHCMQQWFTLSDLAMEEAFFDTPIYRERRASSYLSPRSCGQWRHIFAARGRSDDRVAFRVERDGRDVRPVARMA